MPTDPTRPPKPAEAQSDERGRPRGQRKERVDRPLTGNLGRVLRDFLATDEGKASTETLRRRRQEFEKADAQRRQQEKAAYEAKRKAAKAE